MYDVLIIGSGVIGASVAYHLSYYDIKTLMLEKENDVAEGTTIANSAVIHAGHDPEKGTLKEIFNVKGNRMYKKLCEHLYVDLVERGAFVVAHDTEKELGTLEDLFKNAEERGIPAEMMSGDEARKREPHISDSICRAMWLPTTMTVDPWNITIAMVEEAMENGMELGLNEKVVGIEKKEDGYLVKTEKNEFETRYIVNAAGVYADEISQMLAGNKEFNIRPRKGEYFVLDREEVPFVKSIIYPVPGINGKGVLAIPTVHGNVLLGPDSEFIEDKEGINTHAERLNFVRDSINKTLKDIPYEKVIRSFAGLRATGNTGDFIIGEEENNKGFINVAAIESPGLSSAPAIGMHVAEDIIVKGLGAKKQEEHTGRRKPVTLHDKTLEEKNEFVAKDKRFGNMICRCEQITEGEIVDCIKRPAGARTVKGIKKRARPGAGRCQGGFCEPKIVEILARELGISPLEIRYGGEDSKLFQGETKQGAEGRCEK